mgnify:CR=1 FL=1
MAGPLTLASGACAALRELEVHSWHLDQPPAPLAHLTRLSLSSATEPQDGTPQLRCLADAALRLEVLSFFADFTSSVPTAAVEGHPCLRELRMHTADSDRAWLRVLPQLPALSDLVLDVPASWFEGEEMEGTARGTAGALCVCEWLGHCVRLSNLKETVRGATVPALEAMVVAGAAAGGRLRTLIVGNIQLPPTRDAVARAMYTLMACYPHLEVLTLQLCALWEWGASSAVEVLSSRQLLAAVPLVAPLCPALRKVRICLPGEEATWLRPRA